MIRGLEGKYSSSMPTGDFSMPTGGFSMAEYLEGGAVTIASAVRRANGVVEVTLDCARLIADDELRMIDAAISERLAPEAVSCRFRLKGGSPDEASLLELWSSTAPQLAPLLALCRLEGRGSSYTLRVPPRYLTLLSDGAVGRFLAYLGSVYELELGIFVEGDASLPDGLDEPAAVLRDLSGSRAPAVNRARAASKQKPRRGSLQDVILGKEITRAELVKMCELDDRSGRVTVQGSLLDLEVFVSKKRGTTVLTLTVTDKTNTVFVKLFLDELARGRVVPQLEKVKKDGSLLIVRGLYRYDNYARDYCIFADDINKKPFEMRTDNAPDKRVELHLHTKMSAMDATTNVKEVIARAAKWGHRAIAITDHGVVHAFPEAKKAAKASGIKLIFGCEGYLVPDCELILPAEGEEFAALALTHTGSGAHARVFELAAAIFNENGVVSLRRISVNAGVSQSAAVAALTGCTDDELERSPTLADALSELLGYIGERRLVVHGTEGLRLLHTLLGEGCALDKVCADTAMLERYLAREHSGAALPAVGAEEAARRTAESAIGLFKLCLETGGGLIPIVDATVCEPDKQKSRHIIILAETQSGLKNLYKLVSYSNLEHFYRTPRIPKSLLSVHREGLILGSACEAGELFRAMVGGADEEELMRIASFYDYLEIQPIGNNQFLVREGLARDDAELRELNRRIVELGEKLGKPVVATGDVHFLEPEDAIFRAILMAASNFKDANLQPPLYFRTTEDMLEEFSYLGREKAYEVVVASTNAIADRCGELRPFLDDKQTYAPELPGAKEELTEMSLKKAHELYGDELPEIVQKRLDKEFNSIIGNGYSSLYMVAQKLVSKSLSDGYLVGSRGSVGSSFVAYLAGITEVNALPAHYRCPSCRYSEFPSVGDRSRCGVDLPKKSCPVCGTELKRDGYEIPFETFLGFKGDKTPDIDLNFSGEYQPVAHKFTEEMFGVGHAFRAGTISGLQDKTAYGYVLHYCEENGLHPSEAEKTRLAAGCVGVRKTTGQHPGGIVIVPEGLEIYDFCPVQHPAEKVDAESVTTHFDFHALDDKLVKLDILGHDDPTALRMLFDITGIDPKTIPLDDPQTMAIFKTDEPLGVSLKALDCDIGSLGISEFGTGFVRGMLDKTRPTTMEELVRIAGLSHGTDVWLGNAEELIKSGTANLMQVICTRDDIMNYLIAHGGEPSLSFKTMENVRKGKGLTEEMEDAMHAISIPDWYIESCKKIKYMFPRAHAAAYVMMSFRVAYFKVHHPLAYYSVYFTVRADTFDIELALGGAERVLKNLNELKALADADKKQKDQIIILELVYEMNLRGIELLPIDLYKSSATRFTIEDGRLRPPFTAIGGLGENAARQLEEGARGGRFVSREELVKRTRVNSAVLEKLERLGCLDELPDSDQVSLF